MSIRDIIKRAGGVHAVAKASETTEKPIKFDAVYKWFRNGIPDDHWPVVIGLAGVTPQAIYSANQALRKTRPKRRPRGRPNSAARDHRARAA